MDAPKRMLKPTSIKWTHEKSAKPMTPCHLRRLPFTRSPQNVPNCPRSPQILSRSHQNVPKSTQNVPKLHPDHTRVFPDLPTSPQNVPKSPHNFPKSLQIHPERPHSNPERLKMRIWGVLRGNFGIFCDDLGTLWGDLRQFGDALGVI